MILDTLKDELPAIQVGKPTTLVGEPSSQFLLKTTNQGTPFYIQTPICYLKQGIAKGANKKNSCELTFATTDSEFYNWIEQLENFSIEYINQKKQEWFKTELSAEDVDNLFLSPFKIYRSSKTYGMRVQVTSLGGSSSVQIYDSKKNSIPFDESFITDKPIIAVIEWVGIRCTVKNFFLEFELKQLMLIEEKEVKPLASECLIQKPGTGSVASLQESVDNAGRNENQESLNNDDKNGEKGERGEKGEIRNDDSENIIEEIKELDLENVTVEGDDSVVKIKSSSEVYQGIYQKALKRALMARDLGVLNYLESKNITDSSILLDATDKLQKLES
jgi:hypothetical protein